MKVSHEIEMDLVRHSKPTIHVVQGDAFSRRIRLTLFSNKDPWYVPREASALVRYKKPNKECGAYDTLPDGSNAITIYRNHVTIVVTPDVLSHPGQVSVIVSLILGDQELSTFELLFIVQSNFSSELQDPDSGASITGLLPAPDSAEVGQFLVVEEVNERGRVTKIKADDLIPIFAAYLEETLPNALPNPQALTIDGTTYDGSKAVEVKTPKAFYVTATLNDDAPGQATVDKTIEEIQAAYDAGKPISCILNATAMGEDYPLPIMIPFVGITEDTGTAAMFYGLLGGAWLALMVGDDAFEAEMGSKAFCIFSGAELARKNDIPSALKNPNAATINGTTYDGSVAVDFTSIINSMIDTKLDTIAVAEGVSF